MGEARGRLLRSLRPPCWLLGSAWERVPASRDHQDGRGDRERHAGEGQGRCAADGDADAAERAPDGDREVPDRDEQGLRGVGCGSCRTRRGGLEQRRDAPEDGAPGPRGGCCGTTRSRASSRRPVSRAGTATTTSRHRRYAAQSRLRAWIGGRTRSSRARSLGCAEPVRASARRGLGGRRRRGAGYRSRKVDLGRPRASGLPRFWVALRASGWAGHRPCSRWISPRLI